MALDKGDELKLNQICRNLLNRISENFEQRNIDELISNLEKILKLKVIVNKEVSTLIN